jgi:hypothetical protein
MFPHFPGSAFSIVICIAYGSEGYLFFIISFLSSLSFFSLQNACHMVLVVWTSFHLFNEHFPQARSLIRFGLVFLMMAFVCKIWV